MERQEHLTQFAKGIIETYPKWVAVRAALPCQPIVPIV